MAHESNICSKCRNPLSFKPRVDVDFRLDPSMSSSHRTREIISLCNEDLDDYDAQITRLQNKILHFQTQKKRLSDYKTQLQSFFFRQLPHEILCTIFESVCTENLLQEYPWPPSLEQPVTWFSLPAITYLPALAISAVCTRWRSLALASPRLWSQLRLETGCAKKALDDGFMSTVQLYLERSVYAPLSINIVTEGLNYGPENWTSPVFDLLLNHTERWRTFSYTGDYDLMELFGFHSSFPILENLTLNGDQQELVSSDFGPFKHAPKLLTVATGAYITDLPQTWNQLGSLQILNLNEDICCLHGFPNLTNLELLSPLNGFEMGITLAKLESFKVKGLYAQSLLSDMFSSLTVPSLTEIVIDTKYDQSSLTWTPDAFNEFILRSRCILTTLSLRLLSISDQSLIAAFRILPSLVNFSIDEMLDPDRESPITSHLISCMSASSLTPILPKLRSLSITTDNAFFDDAAFVDMVSSRWLPGSSAAAIGIDCLRSLVLHLPMREVDEEIYTRLENLDRMGMRVVVTGKRMTDANA